MSFGSVLDVHVRAALRPVISCRTLCRSRCCSLVSLAPPCACVCILHMCRAASCIKANWLSLHEARAHTPDCKLAFLVGRTNMHFMHCTPPLHASHTLDLSLCFYSSLFFCCMKHALPRTSCTATHTLSTAARLQVGIPHQVGCNWHSFICILTLALSLSVFTARGLQ